MRQQPQRPARVDRSLRPHHAAERTVVALIVLGMLTLFIFVRPQQPANLTGAEAAQAILDFRDNMPDASTAERIGQVTSGAAAADVLEVLGANATDAAAAVAALRQTGLVDRKRMRPGTALTAYFDESRMEGETSRLIAVSIKPNAKNTLLATRQADDSFFVSVLTARLVTSHRRAAGVIDTDLQTALVAAGGTPAHAASFSALFPDDSSLAEGGLTGERFDTVFEVAEDERGNFIENGELVFAAFNGVTSRGSWYRYTPGDTGRTEFFNANGVAALPFLTRFPIGRAPINSGFGQRYHPLTGQLHLHTGIDFRAPAGTPIQVAGEGTIAFMGFSEGYGRHIRVRHKRGYETLYAHMSSFSGLTKGEVVNTGDVIGYVGDSGSATGEHLHFEIRRDGRWVNPMTLELPSGRNLASAPAELAAFMKQKSEIDALRGATIATEVATAVNVLPVIQPNSP